MNLKTSKYKKKYIVIIYKKKYRIIQNKKKTSLLKILKLNHINIFYQCQKGYCGTCNVKLIHGKIQYFKKNILAVIKPNNILSCCCIVKHNITIKI